MQYILDAFLSFIITITVRFSQASRSFAFSTTTRKRKHYTQNCPICCFTTIECKKHELDHKQKWTWAMEKESNAVVQFGYYCGKKHEEEYKVKKENISKVFFYFLFKGFLGNLLLEAMKSRKK